jgi:hypothetical protein
MVNLLGQRQLTRLCRFGAIVLVGLWLATPAGQAAGFDCDYDQICDGWAGENCGNCSDCSSQCYCGDEVCNSGETCSGCIADGYALCTCGDSVCDTPAEGGGVGNYSSWDTCEETGFPQCSFCPSDCGDCNPDFCRPQVCDGLEGTCTECWTNGECEFSFSDLKACYFGECVECTSNDHCTTPGKPICNQDDHICVPEVLP